VVVIVSQEKTSFATLFLGSGDEPVNELHAVFIVNITVVPHSQMKVCEYCSFFE
jgi:hypothetical protein